MWHEMGDMSREFFQAAILGEEDRILAYIKDGYDVNKMHEDDEIGKDVSALMVASENGHMDCVRILLSFGADISHLSQRYTKAILYASQQNLSQSLLTLAATGMFGRECYGDILPAYALLTDYMQHQDIEKVISALSDSNFSEHVSVQGSWVNVLCFLILAGCLKRDVDCVIEKFKIDVNGFNCRGFTPLISAVIVSNVEMMAYLIEIGADVNCSEDLLHHSKEIDCKWVDNLVGFKDKDNDAGKSGYFPCSATLDSDGKSPLMFAVWTGKLNVVKYLLSIEDIDINCVDSQGRTALVHSVYAGMLDIWDELVAQGVDVNGKNPNTGKTVLYDAVHAGRESVLSRILGVVSNKTDADGSDNSVLSYAAEMGKTNCLKVLLARRDCDVNSIRFGQSYTPLMYAACSKHYECIKLLLDYGADLRIKNLVGETALTIAAEFGDVPCLKLLIDENLNGRGKDLESEFHIEKLIQPAACNKDIKVLKFVLPYCKNIDKLDSNFYTALMCAANDGQTEALHLLMQKGANINLINSDGETAIWFALKEKQWHCFELLIEARANIQYVHEKCKTLLIYAAQMEEIRYLDLLLQNGAPINQICQHSNYTPLTAAISCRRLENVRLLLVKGADVNLCENHRKGDRPIMYAARWPECLQLLIEFGADLNFVNKDEETIWFPVTQSLECLKIVLENGSVLDKICDGSPRRLKSVHRDSPFYLNHQWDVRTLLLLFEYGVFEWDWYLYSEQEKDIHKIAFAVVNVASSAPVIFMKEDEAGNMVRSSLLQEAFLHNCIGTVRYLLANLFLTSEDYLVLLGGTDFRMKMRKKCEESTDDEEENEDNLETVEFFNRVTSQPWRLETLSFLKIATCLTASSRNQENLLSQQIDSLVYPEIMKSKMRYETAVKKLCPSEWRDIGKLCIDGEGEKEEDILAVMKPLYPREQDLIKCDDVCLYCNGCGFSLT